MITKEKIKSIKQLQIKKYREAHRLFIVEGATNTLDYLDSHIELHELYATYEFINKNPHLTNYKVIEVSEKEMSRITALKNHSPLLGIFKIPEYSKPSIIVKDSWYLALDQIHDPGNLGTIIRTADWFGIKDIYCSINSVDAYNPKVVQATMGSLSRVRIKYVCLESLLKQVGKNTEIYGAVLNGNPVNKVTNPKPGVILIGSEAHGISDNLMKIITYKLTIPNKNTEANNRPESLNASIAAGIMCYALIKYQTI